MARGKKTAPATEEAVYAHYVTAQSYADTARHFKMPFHTVVGIVDRLKTDDLASLRHAMRVDLAQRCWAAAGKLVPHIVAGNLGSEHTSQGIEAAKALGELSRAAALFEPDAADGVSAPTEIHVHTHMPPPPEFEGQTVAVTASTTSTGRLS